MVKRQVEELSISDILAYEGNARKHPDHQLEILARSLVEYGWTNPVLIDKNNVVIAGHGRLEAAIRAGLTHAPTIRLEDLTEAQVKAYRIADNRLTDLGGFDEHLLAQELEALKSEDYDMLLTGYTANEVDNLLAELTSYDEETDMTGGVPPVEPTTKPGDIWEMGKHRLICGDASNGIVVESLMQGEPANFIFTSPPYLDLREYKNDVDKVDWLELMVCVFKSALINADTQCIVNLGSITRDGSVYEYWRPWIDQMKVLGWQWAGHYVWDKGYGKSGEFHGSPAPSHEWLFHLRGKQKYINKSVRTKYGDTGDNRHGGKTFRLKDGTTRESTNKDTIGQKYKIMDSVVRITPYANHGTGHPATFPVELPEQIIPAFTNSGDLVYEPFCGSGTTIIAAEKVGRKCYAVEIDPGYCDVIVKRWEHFSGYEAERK